VTMIFVFHSLIGQETTVKEVILWHENLIGYDRFLMKSLIR
jgi:hypothetical protein